MRFSTVFSVLASGAVALAAVVAPAALMARDNELGVSVIVKLGLDVDTCIGKMDECKDIECHKQLFSEFQTAFDDACGGFGGIKGKIEADMATPTAEIFIKIVEKVKEYTSSCDETFAEEVISVYVGLDDKFCTLLKVIEVFVVDICVSVGKILQGAIDIFVLFKFDLIINLCISIGINL